MGFGGFANVIGAAAAGFGGALKDQGLREREYALRMIENQQQQDLREHGATMEHGFRGQEADQQHGYRMQENTASQDRQDTRSTMEHGYRLDESDHSAKNARSLEGMREANADNDVGNYTEDDQGEMVGFDKRGRVTKTGVKLGGLAKKDRDLISELEPQFSKKIQTMNEDTGDKTSTIQLDSAGMAQRLNDMGRPDLAKMYGGGQPAAPNPGPGGSGGGAMAVPPAFANKPDGTVLSKGGKNYVKRGGQLIPQ